MDYGGAPPNPDLILKRIPARGQPGRIVALRETEKTKAYPVKSPSENFLRPTWAEISLSKLERNLARVRRLAGSHRRVMAVVKADAYGHGAVPVAQALAEAGVDWFGVATVEEALDLRRKRIRQPILLLGGLYMSKPEHLIEYNLTPTVSSTARLDTYAECARRLGKPIEFHLKVDTGMGRLGMPPETLEAFLEHYRQLEGVTLKGLLTHLASAEEAHGHRTQEQVQRLLAALQTLKSSGIEPEMVHVSNSAALGRWASGSGKYGADWGLAVRILPAVFLCLRADSGHSQGI